MHAGPDFEPRGRYDHGVDERALDAVEDRRFVALVEDADGHQEHAGADVEAARQEEVDVGLFELQLPGFLEPFDERVLQFQFAHEADSRRELMRDEQDEAVKIEAPVRQFGLVVVELHVAREAGRGLVVLGGSGGLAERGRRGGQERNPDSAQPHKIHLLTNQNDSIGPPKSVRVKRCSCCSA